MILQNNTLELKFNYHRFFEHYETDHSEELNDYLNWFVSESNTLESLQKRKFMYSASWITETEKPAFDYGTAEIIKKAFRSPLLTKSKFSPFFLEGCSKNTLPFPFGMIDFKILDGFKGCNNIAGIIRIIFRDNEFILEGDINTLKPAQSGNYDPLYTFSTNLELEAIVNKISERFNQVENLIVKVEEESE